MKDEKELNISLEDSLSQLNEFTAEELIQFLELNTDESELDTSKENDNTI